MNARSGGNVDDAARLAVLDAEVGSGGTDELEGSGAVQGNDGVPLLVGDLVDDAWKTILVSAPQPSLVVGVFLTIPSETRVVHDDMDLAIAKLCRLFDKIIDVVIVENVAWYRGGLAAGLVDLVAHFLALLLNTLPLAISSQCCEARPYLCQCLTQPPKHLHLQIVSHTRLQCLGLIQ